MGYFEDVRDDVETWVNDNLNPMCGEWAEYDDVDDFAEVLNDTLWAEDSVTGNGSGSYTFSRERAKEYVLDDIDTVREALREFGTDAETIADKFLTDDWEYFDVTARCYVLGSAIADYIEDNRDEIEEAIEEAHREEE